jgi:transcriptional regulator with XRE-family HTH domain
MTASTMLREARLAANMSQAQLAATLGVSQPVIARLETAAANPTYATLERALRATGHRLALTREPEVGLDCDQLRARLAMTPAQRLQTFTASQQALVALIGTARRVA